MVFKGDLLVIIKKMSQSVSERTRIIAVEQMMGEEFVTRAKFESIVAMLMESIGKGISPALLQEIQKLFASAPAQGLEKAQATVALNRMLNADFDANMNY